MPDLSLRPGRCVLPFSNSRITPDAIAQARQDLADWPLFLGANPRATGRKEIVDLLGQAIRRYGLKLLIFDNLHMLARSVDHRSEEIGALTKGFRLLAMEHEVPLVLIAQPRKLGTVHAAEHRAGIECGPSAPRASDEEGSER